MSFYCYLLSTSSGKNTYIGATTDPNRRLDQHNRKKTGGARATGIQVLRGETWRRICIIKGIPEWRSALQIEWRWKQLSRKNTSKNPIIRRFHALYELFTMDKPTTNAIPYEAYPDGIPSIVWETQEDQQQFLDIIDMRSEKLKAHQIVQPASDLIQSFPSTLFE